VAFEINTRMLADKCKHDQQKQELLPQSTVFCSKQFVALYLLSQSERDEHDCKFDVNGKSYDLSSLNGRTATGDDSKISTYHYNTAVCSDMTDECEDIMTGQKLRGVVYQMGGEPGQQSVCWDMLAKWDNVTAGPLDSSAGKPSGTDGLTLQFHNGDPCRGSPRKTILNMICDKAEIGTISGSQDDFDSCLFIINFPTSHACSGGPTPGPKNTTAPPATTEPSDFEIDGDYVGYLTCVSEKCNFTPNKVEVTISVDCQHMIGFIINSASISDSELWYLVFERCEGGFATGVVKPETKISLFETLRFDAFYMGSKSQASLNIIMYEDKPPYAEFMKLGANRVKPSPMTTPEHDITTTPIPEVDWGINGTFIGHFNTSNGTIVVTIQGDCNDVAALTSGIEGTEVWHVRLDICVGDRATGTIKNADPNSRSEPLEFEAFLVDAMLQIFIFEENSSHRVLVNLDATKARSEDAKISETSKQMNKMDALRRMTKKKIPQQGFSKKVHQSFNDLKSEMRQLDKLVLEAIEG